MPGDQSTTVRAAASAMHTTEAETGPVVGILALQGDVREHAAHLQRLGACTLPVRRESDLEGIDGLIIPGGESTAMSNLIRVFELEQPLRKYIAARRPVYGSCAGMIMLADIVLDARPDAISFAALDITVRRNAFGRQVDSFETTIRFAEDHDIHAVFIRAPWVEAVGFDASVLASVDDGSGTIRPVAVQQGSALVTAFHPEVTNDLTVHRHFLNIITGAP